MTFPWLLFAAPAALGVSLIIVAVIRAVRPDPPVIYREVAVIPDAPAAPPPTVHVSIGPELAAAVLDTALRARLAPAAALEDGRR